MDMHKSSSKRMRGENLLLYSSRSDQQFTGGMGEKHQTFPFQRRLKSLISPFQVAPQPSEKRCLLETCLTQWLVLACTDTGPEYRASCSSTASPKAWRERFYPSEVPEGSGTANKLRRWLCSWDHTWELQPSLREWKFWLQSFSQAPESFPSVSALYQVPWAWKVDCKSLLVPAAH